MDVADRLKHFFAVCFGSSVVGSLGEPRRYLDEIDKLHGKYSQRRLLYDHQQDGVPFSMMSLDRRKLARVLARAVSRGKYELQPAQIRRITSRNKERFVFHFELTDRIVHGVVASILTDSSRRRLSPRVFSYLKGSSWWSAVSDFSRYVRDHRRECSDPKARGLFVLRRDIRQYADSIPVGDRSPLWPMLERLLYGNGSNRRPPAHLRQLIQRLVRPEVLFDGRLAIPLRGVPTGSPIASLLFNLYLTPLDRDLEAVPGGFYARYSDDFLFAHPDPEVVRRKNARIDEVLRALQLSTSEAKDRYLYFNGAARSSPAWPEARGVDSVGFLGCDISFRGTVSLGREKSRGLLRDLGARARRTRRVLGETPLEAAGPVLCRTINAALDPNERPRHKSALLLRTVVTDRNQLKQLDYRIARIVLHEVTGDPSPRAFRQISYRKLRRDWGLVSLYHARNRRGRRRSPK